MGGLGGRGELYTLSTSPPPPGGAALGLSLRAILVECPQGLLTRPLVPEARSRWVLQEVESLPTVVRTAPSWNPFPRDVSFLYPHLAFSILPHVTRNPDIRTLLCLLPSPGTTFPNVTFPRVVVECLELLNSADSCGILLKKRGGGGELRSRGNSQDTHPVEVHSQLEHHCVT